MASKQKNLSRLRKYSDSTVYHRNRIKADTHDSDFATTEAHNEKSRDLKRSQSSFPSFTLGFHRKISRVKNIFSPNTKSSSLEELDLDSHNNNRKRNYIMKTTGQASVTNDHWLDQDDDIFINGTTTQSKYQDQFWTQNIDDWLDNFHSVDGANVKHNNTSTEEKISHDKSAVTINNNTINHLKKDTDEMERNYHKNNDLQTANLTSKFNNSQITAEDIKISSNEKNLNFRKKNSNLDSIYDNVSLPTQQLSESFTENGFSNLNANDENDRHENDDSKNKTLNKENTISNDITVNKMDNKNEQFSSSTTDEVAKQMADISVDNFGFYREKFDYYVKDYITTYLSTQTFGDGLVAKNWCRELSTHVRENIRQFSRDDFKLVVTAHIGPNQASGGPHIFLKAQTVEGEDKFMVSVYETDHLFIWVYAMIACN